MISRIFILVLLAFQIVSAEAFDVCDKHGFEKAELGWIRSVSVNQKVYVDFKVNIDELGENGIAASPDIAPALAKDAASNAYYKLYKSVMPPASEKLDLIYSGTQAYLSTCWLKKTYGFRTPLSTFQWAEPSSSDDDYLPAIKDLLKRKQLID